MIKDAFAQVTRDVFGASLYNAAQTRRKTKLPGKIVTAVGSFAAAQSVSLMAQAVESTIRHGETKENWVGAITAASAEVITFPAKVGLSLAVGTINPLLGVAMYTALTYGEHATGRAVQSLPSRRVSSSTAV